MALCSTPHIFLLNDIPSHLPSFIFSDRYGLYGDQEWAPGFVFDPTRDVCAAPYANYDAVGQMKTTYSRVQASISSHEKIFLSSRIGLTAAPNARV